MDEQSVTENRMKIKRPLWQIVVLIIFSVIGIISALPCLCPQGAVKGSIKSLFLVIVMAKLLFGFYKNNLTKIDIVVWMGAFFVFCFGIEILWSPEIQEKNVQFEVNLLEKDALSQNILTEEEMQIILTRSPDKVLLYSLSDSFGQYKWSWKIRTEKVFTISYIGNIDEPIKQDYF